MRHINHRRLQIGVQLGQFQPHLHPEQRVQIGQRLVEQKHLRIAHQRPPNRHPLPLPPRQLRRPAVHQRLQLQHPGDARPRFRLLGPALPRQRQRETDILRHRQMRVQSIALEHHRHTPPRRFRMGHI